MISPIFLALVAIANAAPSSIGLIEDQHLEKRLNNGLGKTPILGWNGWVSTVLNDDQLHLTNTVFYFSHRTKDSAMQHQLRQH